MVIREIGSAEFGLVWPIFQAVVARGDSYVYSPDTSFEEAKALWMTSPSRVFVATEGERVVGCYMLKPNHPGLGDHVANAGYMVAPEARGRGLGRKLCEHSMATARAAGYKAMQFNRVVASNEIAVALWQKLGFQIVARLPMAYRHKTRGMTDLFVMYRRLEPALHEAEIEDTADIAA